MDLGVVLDDPSIRVINAESVFVKIILYADEYFYIFIVSTHM